MTGVLRHDPTSVFLRPVRHLLTGVAEPLAPPWIVIVRWRVSFGWSPVVSVRDRPRAVTADDVPVRDHPSAMRAELGVGALRACGRIHMRASRS